ncbi:PLP-dependent aminotransferase family protein [Neptunomonas antarctica]|uniref:Transcriptional regulator, GntR family n=1 Tax=Neptunomonas antarctica TaxID=619304 RepID=A0A1N7PNZ6_9GAMM|nr:PLP-dependent aminotransferase family protein [Neptunomonas antarctica]SIT12207.1 transcriptional regulator, GntR family [Neptunomonas antarctica]
MKIYQKVIVYIESQLLSGALQPYDLLPSVRHLAQVLNVSKNSIIRAYMVLEQTGTIQAHPRKGFSVKPDTVYEQAPKPIPKKVILGATSLDIIGPAQRQADVIFGSANPDTRFKGRQDFFKQLNRLVRAELKSPAIYSHYQAPPGDINLRQQIAKKTHCGYAELDAEEIVITNGAQEAISLALRCIAQPGDIIAVESPCFYGILQCAEALGLRVIEVPANIPDGIDLKQLAETLNRWPVNAILLNPHANNPLGFIMPDDNKSELLALAQRYDLAIIEDDVFGELIHSTQRRRTLKSMDTDGRVILCGSLSKILDPDIRIGWVAPGRYFDQVNYLKYVTTLATSGLMQHAAALWMESANFNRHVKQLQNRYRQRKLLFIESLKAYFPAEAHITVPESGFLSWITLPFWLDGDIIFTRAKAEGISLTPGSLFGTEQQFQHCIRLNFSTFDNTEKQQQALARLAEIIIEELNSQT